MLIFNFTVVEAERAPQHNGHSEWVASTADNRFALRYSLRHVKSFFARKIGVQVIKIGRPVG